MPYSKYTVTFKSGKTVSLWAHSADEAKHLATWRLIDSSEYSANGPAVSAIDEFAQVR